MGDSDDEYSHRRGSGRDKFRSERDGPGFQRGGGRGRDFYGGGGRGGDWGGRRENYGEYGRRHYSPDRQDLSPPQKRMRRDWGDGNYQSFGDMGRGGFNNDKPIEPEYPTQPPMQTFKSFLSSQDDNISDEDAIKKYTEYKMEFKKQQISEFFLAHKDEEWFRSKYHPSECVTRLTEQKNTLRRRADIFMHLLELGYLGDAKCDIDAAQAVVKVLDAAVILMEGGNDDDLRCLGGEGVTTEPAPAAEVKEPVKPDEKPEAESEPAKPDPEPEPTKEDEPEKEAEKPEDDKMDTSKEEETPAEERKDSAEGDASGDESEAEADKSTEKAETESKPEVNGSKEAAAEEEKETDTVAEEIETQPAEPAVAPAPVEKGPRRLHETLSIFLRNLAPNISKGEVEQMCRKYPGFMRVALQDPQPERKFFRRGWVTFDRSVNIKDICWNLNNIRVCKADIKHAAKIVQNLDKKWNIWAEDEKQDKAKDEMEGRFGLVSKNPILKNITDYLVDEGSAEEDEYLGIIENKPVDPNPDLSIERDEPFLQVLDKMILYLRIVHSFDFYSAVEYPNEDEMPHRCGIMHARGNPFPTSRPTQRDVSDWLETFEVKMKPHLEMKYRLEMKEAEKLGLKEEESEVEAFIKANTQEISKDKWLCPLSGKKFKGEDFVRKHILNKHSEKVDEVKQDVVFFNNYLMDPKRPQLPEHPRARTAPPAAEPYNNGDGNRGSGGGYGGRGGYGGGGGYDRGGFQRGGYRGGRGSYDYGHGRRGGGMTGRGYGGGYDRPPPESYQRRDPPVRDYDAPLPRRPLPYKNRSDPRSVIEYKDLDAPEEGDIFS